MYSHKQDTQYINHTEPDSVNSDGSEDVYNRYFDQSPLIVYEDNANTHRIKIVSIANPTIQHPSQS